MYVVCPSCQDAFKIHSGYLAVAQGHVRCGGCQAVFDATAFLYDSLEEAGDAVQRLRTAEQDIDGVVEVARATVKADVSAVATCPDATNIHAVVKTNIVAWSDCDFYAQPIVGEIPPRLDQVSIPEVVILNDGPESQASHISKKVWWGAAASVFLSVLISGQYLWKERNQLAADTQFRPWMERYCVVLNCDLPLRRDLSKIEILEREVKDHPRVKDALLVSATILNDAAFIQDYPVFEISFSDMSGTPVSVRRFKPDEYLSNNKDASQGFQPGEKTQLVLEVLDPGKQAVSFQLEFL